MSNPLQLVYDAIWSLLKGHAAFQAAVPPNNCVDRSLKRPVATPATAGRSPMVDVVPVSIAFRQDAASNATRMVLIFGIVIEANGAAWQQLLKTAWAIVVAMHGWESVLKALTWKNKQFVVSCAQLNDQAKIEYGTNVGINYRLIWAGEVVCWLPEGDVVWE